jgi:hypothetical protein
MIKAKEETALDPAARPTSERRTWWGPLIETLVAAIVVAAILYRLGQSDRKFETNSILIAVLPVLFWLLVSGRLASFKAFGIELNSAIRRVSSERITADRNLMASSAIEFEPVDPGTKDKVGKIGSYIARRVPAISFQLGKLDYYDAGAIQKYLDDLSPHSFFKWIVFQYQDGRFGGLMPARKLQAFGESLQRGWPGYEAIKNKIEQESVHGLPGFIGPEHALSVASTKGQAIARFGKTDLDELPVVDGNDRFVGVLNRGQLLGGVLSSILQAADARP